MKNGKKEIFKLRNNKKLNKQDLQTLEELMWSEVVNKADYEKEFGDTPVNKLVRRIVGLDRIAANKIFSEFLNEKS